MMRSGDLICVERGIYLDSSGDFDLCYFFKEDIKHGVFLSVYTLSTTIYRCHSTGDGNHDSPRFPSTLLRQRSPDSLCKKELFDLGITVCKTIYGNKVRTYDHERTICDYVRNREKQRRNSLSKPSTTMRIQKNRCLDRLYECSKKMTLYQKTKEIMGLVYE